MRRERRVERRFEIRRVPSKMAVSIVLPPCNDSLVNADPAKTNIKIKPCAIRTGAVEMMRLPLQILILYEVRCNREAFATFDP